MKKKIISKKKYSSQKRSFHKPGKIIYFFVLMTGFILALTAVQIGLSSSETLLTPCANTETCANDLAGSFDSQANEAIFLGNRFTAPPPPLAVNTAPTNVLGEESTDNKRIYVDLATQRLYAFEGNTVVHNFLVSTGKWGRTPTGEFRVWIKLRFTRMSGGNKEAGTYYNLPNVPFTMFFYNTQYPKHLGYGIHGAYWHNNFGHPMSHGCINMRNEDAEVLYNWATPTVSGNTTYASNENPGTPITIYGVAPQE